MQSNATTVAAYLAELPAERRAVLKAVLEEFRKNIDPTFEEGIGYGMIGYSVPHSVYPAGYHCDPKQPLPFAGMAAQKNYYSVYLMCLYQESGHQKWFVEEWKKTGKKLNMGKSCIRFKKLEDISLELIGQAIARISAKEFIAIYEQSLGGRAKAKSVAKKTTTSKRPAARRSTTKKASPVKKKVAKKAAKKTTKKKAAKKK